MIGFLALGLTGDEWLRLAVAGGLSGLLLEAFRTVRDRKGSDANVAKTITDAATVLLVPLTLELTKCTAERDEARTDLKNERAANTRLTTMLADCNSRLNESRRDPAREAALDERDAAASRRDEKADKRADGGDRRDVAADRRDVAADRRDNDDLRKP